MVQVLGVVVIVFSLLLVVGAITGRVTVKSCCAPADPRLDARMAAAFQSADTGATDPPPALMIDQPTAPPTNKPGR